MKHILLIALLYAFNLCCAQDIAKDTLTLDDVVVGNQDGEKVKVKKVKYRQDPWCLQEFDHNLELVTLVDKLPPGRIHSLTFYANEILQAGYISDDAVFEVMLYQVNPDGTPGKKLSSRPITITLSITDKGEFPVNVYSLDIHSSGSFFAGLKRLDMGNLNSFGVNICCICKADDFTS